LGIAIGTVDTIVVGLAAGATGPAGAVVALAAGETGELVVAVSVGVTPVALTSGQLQARINIAAMDRITRRRFFKVPPFTYSP
jgi:hypothetical protein